MKNRVRGGGLGVTGLVLGIIAVTCGVLAAVAYLILGFAVAA